ncbi:MAG: hypothetical protein ACOYOJ_14860 [Alsobacter sp.]
MFDHLHDATARCSRGALRLLGAMTVLGLTIVTGEAQQPAAETDALRPFTDKFSITTTVPEPAEFVKKSRPSTMDYRPVGVVPPARGTKVRTADEVKSLEAEMESTRRRHDVAGRRPTPGAKLKPDAKPKPDAKSKPGAKSKPDDRAIARPAVRPLGQPARPGG